MFFKNKNKIRDREYNHLLFHLEELKSKLDNQKQLIERSLDPSDDVLFRAKITESLYSLLLREARVGLEKKNGLS